ncbi:MAG: transposase [Sulfolobales archaeon]
MDLPGLREAIKEVYPLADFQHCILHRVMASLRRVRKRDREAVAYDLRKIYKARSEAKFLRGFEGFKRRWMKVYSDVIRSWEERMEELISYLRYPGELRAFKRERYRDEQIRINTNSEQFHTQKLDITFIHDNFFINMFQKST